jgi:hypothetical protein
MGYYHHELEQYPDYIGGFEFRSGSLDVAGRWYCTACEEIYTMDEDELDPGGPEPLEEWYARPTDNSLVSLLREFDNHVEDYHC